MCSSRIAKVEFRPAVRRGFTVVELLVSIAILGVLAALILPAISSSRATAERLQCVNNLKQIALASQNYAAQHGDIPYSGPSPLRSLLSVLDPTVRPRGNGWGPGGTPTPDYYVCPADPHALTAESHVSYRASVGTESHRNGVGRTSERNVRRLREITDGASQTVLFSERRVEPWDRISPPTSGYPVGKAAADPSGWFWYVDAARRDADGLVAACLTARTGVSPVVEHSTSQFKDIGSWFHGDLPPQSPACYGGGSTEPLAVTAATLISATSIHPQVSVAFVDGSVRGFSGQTDRDLWAALNTAIEGEFTSGF